MDIDLQLLNGALDILVLVLLGFLLLRPKKKTENSPNLDEIKKLINEATSASNDLNLELNTQQRELKDLLLSIDKKKLELSEVMAKAQVAASSRPKKDSKVAAKPSREEAYFSSYDPVFEYMLEKPQLPTFKDVLGQGNKLERLAREQTNQIKEMRDDPTSRLISKVEVMQQRRDSSEETGQVGGDDNDPRLGVLGKN